MPLVDEARRLAGIVDRLRGPLGNSGNTRALLIEPMLSALGWDTTDLGQVVRDWPLNEVISIAYSLRIADESAMLIQARGVMETVDDPAFVAQTLEHAAGDGAPWCVLTNGLTYRVYKTGEPADRGHGFLFEVEIGDLARATNPEAAANLELLHRAAIARGDLDRRSAELFLDPRVREALAELCRNPTPAFIAAMNDSLGRPSVRVEELRASLTRVLEPQPVARDVSSPPKIEPVITGPVATDHASPGWIAVRSVESPGNADSEQRVPQQSERGRWASLDVQRDQRRRDSDPAASETAGASGETTTAPAETGRWRRPAQSEPPAARPEYALAEYLAGRSAEMVRLFEQLDAYAASLGEDTARHVRKQYIEYFRGSRFWFTLEVLGERVHLNLALDSARVQARWAEDPTLPPIEVRSPGIGQTEYAISDASQLPASRQLIRLAYDRISAPELA
jgi:predicted transport protein